MIQLRLQHARLLVRTDGRICSLSNNKLDGKIIADLIDARTCDCVRLVDREHVMYVDDNGYEKNLPVNEIATALYHEVCAPGTTHAILGDVIIVHQP